SVPIPAVKPVRASASGLYGQTPPLLTPSRGNVPGHAAWGVNTFAEVTPERQLLEGRRLSEEEFTGLGGWLPLMLIRMDCERRLVYINPAAHSLSGYALHEISATDVWQKLVHTDDLPKLLDGFRLVMEEGQTYRQEVRYRAKDGSEKSVYAV